MEIKGIAAKAKKLKVKSEYQTCFCRSGNENTGNHRGDLLGRKRPRGWFLRGRKNFREGLH